LRSTKGKDGIKGRGRGRSRSRLKVKKSFSKYFIAPDVKIEYKNLPLLQRYVTNRGKILSRRISGVTTKQQRELNRSVKRAKYLGLLPVGSAKRRRV